jgi:ketosteroid isomerase-like protein
MTGAHEMNGSWHMKQTFTALCLGTLVALLAGAGTDPGQQAGSDIERLLNAWHHAAAVADEAAYFNALAPGAVFLGTDARERWTKEEFQEWAAPFFQRPSAWVFTASRRRVYLAIDGNTAWFDEDLVSRSYWPCRGSGVLEKVAGRWLIRQYNLSLTIPNEATAAIKPLVEAALQKQEAPVQ